MHTTFAGVVDKHTRMASIEAKYCACGKAITSIDFCRICLKSNVSNVQTYAYTAESGIIPYQIY
jgi:hypothetical protein